MVFKVFVDDSGSKDYKNSYNPDNTIPEIAKELSRTFWNDNYFVLCGVLVSEEDIEVLDREIREIKKRYFGTDQVEIKSTWLRYPRNREKYYLDRFPTTDEKLNDFGKEIVGFVKKNPNKIKLIGVVFDKRFYGEAKRLTAEGTPLLKTTQILFERVSRQPGECTVVFDQMDAQIKSTKGHQGNIEAVFQSNSGLQNIYMKGYPKIKKVLFEDSAKENFLQIADICAYNLFRQFQDHGIDWCGDREDEHGSKTTSVYEYLKEIRCNFVSGPNGVVGFGIVFCPTPRKVYWNIQNNCSI